MMNKKDKNTEGSISISPAIQSELEILSKIIVNTVPVEQIYLFGSYANGVPHKDSDLDLYVVLKDDATIRLIDAVTKIHLAIGRKQSMPVDIIANKLDRYKERSQLPTLERTISREGIKIYG
jgi:predicted nucleotidyltransferase